MGEAVEVSVIMAAYNEEEKYIRKSIESILAQTYRNFEMVIVLDNPENEGLKRIIKEYERQDGRIKFLVNDKNLGAHNTRNRAIRHSQGEYIAVMDADDVSEKERLKLQVAAMKEKGADIISGYVKVIDEDGNLIYVMDKLPVQSTSIKEKVKINNCMPHPAFMFKKSVYEELHGYNAIPYCEDYDFLIRACLKDYNLYNIPKIVLEYRMTGNSLSRKNLYRQYLMMKYCQKKYYGNVDVGEYETFLEKNYSEEKAVRYTKASSYFTTACQLFAHKKYFSMLSMLLKAFFISSAYREKMFRYILQLNWRENAKN